MYASPDATRMSHAFVSTQNSSPLWFITESAGTFMPVTGKQ